MNNKDEEDVASDITVDISQRIGARDVHMFEIAHECHQEPWYISEKFWNSFRAGTLPIYVGDAEHVRCARMMPHHSFIDARDFASSKELAHYMLFLSRNRELYDTYFEWKDKPMPEGYNRAKALDWSSFACRLCAYVDRKTQQQP